MKRSEQAGCVPCAPVWQFHAGARPGPGRELFSAHLGQFRGRVCPSEKIAGERVGAASAALPVSIGVQRPPLRAFQEFGRIGP